MGQTRKLSNAPPFRRSTLALFMNQLLICERCKGMGQTRKLSNAPPFHRSTMLIRQEGIREGSKSPHSRQVDQRRGADGARKNLVPHLTARKEVAINSIEKPNRAILGFILIRGVFALR